jgi:hypothetical protein
LLSWSPDVVVVDGSGIELDAAVCLIGSPQWLPATPPFEMQGAVRIDPGGFFALSGSVGVPDLA